MYAIEQLVLTLSNYNKGKMEAGFLFPGKHLGKRHRHKACFWQIWEKGGGEEKESRIESYAK